MLWELKDPPWLILESVLQNLMIQENPQIISFPPSNEWLIMLMGCGGIPFLFVYAYQSPVLQKDAKNENIMVLCVDQLLLFFKGTNFK